MNFNPIIIVGGEPQSIFIEIFLKAIKKIQTSNNFSIIKGYIKKKSKKI